MTLSLPEPISVYFDISNGADDLARVSRCFAPDAVVFDEGRTHEGHEAIQAWQREARRKFEYTVEPVEEFRNGERVTVTARVVGNFPGSPVRLDHVFDLQAGKIQALKIG